MLRRRRTALAGQQSRRSMQIPRSRCYGAEPSRSQCRTRLAVAARRATVAGTQLCPEVSSSVELEKVDGVALEYQRANLVANVDLREIGEPALRRDQRIIRAEQHFSLELSICVLHELRREVLRRP